MKSIMARLLSIGVIGGADGPTSIFIASSPTVPYIIAGIATLIVIGVVLLIAGLIKKTKN